MKNQTRALIAAVSLAFSLPSMAGAFVNFDQNGESGGTLSYNGSTLTGQNIGFDAVNLLGSADGAYECRGCTASFTTGAVSSTFGNNATFKPGGTFNLSGEVIDNKGADAGRVAIPQMTVSGTFNSGTLINTGTGANFIATGSSQDFADVFQDYFETGPQQALFASTNISLGGKFDPDSRYSSDVTNADLTYSVTSDVPEPNDLAIFGLAIGLLMIGMRFSSRRMRFDKT